MSEPDESSTTGRSLGERIRYPSATGLLVALLIALVPFGGWLFLYMLLRYLTGHSDPPRPNRFREPGVIGVVIVWLIAIGTVIFYPLAIYMSWRYALRRQGWVDRPLDERIRNPSSMGMVLVWVMAVITAFFGSPLAIYMSWRYATGHRSPSGPDHLVSQSAPSIEQASQQSPAGAKVCPRCAETVKATALVCRYCGHEFAEGEPQLSGPR